MKNKKMTRELREHLYRAIRGNKESEKVIDAVLAETAIKPQTMKNKKTKYPKCNCEMGDGELHLMTCAVMELTPTPWTISELKDVLDHSYLNAYTEYVVRAVNCHEELLAIVKSCRENNGRCFSDNSTLDDVIAKAEGK